MRRLILILMTAGAIAGASGVSALADAKPNDHNCAGDFFSGRGPESTRGGLIGTAASTQGKDGERGTNLRSFTAAANCGDNNRPPTPEVDDTAISVMSRPSRPLPVARGARRPG